MNVRVRRLFTPTRTDRSAPENTQLPMTLAPTWQESDQGASSIPTRQFSILKIAPTSFFSDYGCHVRIYEETLALQALGNKVTVCTYHTGDDVDHLDIRRAMNTPGHKTVQVGSNIHKLYYDVLLFLNTARTALGLRPQVIHAHLHEGALIGYPISRLLRAPLLFDFQGSLTGEMLDHNFVRRDSPLFKPLRLLEKVVNRMPGAVVTSSRNAADILVRDFSYPPSKVFTIPDCVNPERFRPRWQLPDQEGVNRMKAQLGVPLDRKVVVYLGLLAEYQGIDQLLEAAAHLVQRRKLPVHFLIMGFPGEDRYRFKAAQLGLAPWVTFTGRVPYLQAPDYLLLGDVAVSAKMSETEGNGKLLNYMAAGLPTATFDTPVAREILGDLGVYARRGDPRSLAHALEFLLVEERAASEIALRLRLKAVQDHSWQKAGEQFMEIYQRLTS